MEIILQWNYQKIATMLLYTHAYRSYIPALVPLAIQV